MVSFDVVTIDKPADLNVIIGQAHFIKTVEDLHEALAGASPHLRFGLAFCEASAARLVRRSGNDAGLTELAAANALALAAGHAFVILLQDGFPINVVIVPGRAHCRPAGGTWIRRWPSGGRASRSVTCPGPIASRWGRLVPAGR